MPANDPIPPVPALPAHGGLYVHIPFCLKKCPYCDFYSITDPSRIDPFVDALVVEMGLHRRFRPAIDTVYIGGGTPSLLSARHVERIIRAAHRHFDVRAGAEVTLEVNPGTADGATLKNYRRAGVNRVNIGVQSFHDPSLAFLGRIHTARHARRAVALCCAAGFDRVGLDLICGLPGQTEILWRKDLEAAVDLGAGHLSCYLLTIEPGTPMAADLDRGRFVPLPEAAAAELFALTQSLLADAGYAQYEISNFARSAAEMSRHNRKYWTFAPYIGLGPAAHSFSPPVRRWNHRSLVRYLADLDRGRAPEAGKEVLTPVQQAMERIYLGLRTADGIDIAALNRLLGADFHHRFSAVIQTLDAGGMLIASPAACRLTPAGMRFHESIARMFVDAL